MPRGGTWTITFLYQHPADSKEVLNIHSLQCSGVGTAGIDGPFMDRPEHRVQREVVARGYQMDCGPHQCSAHDFPAGDEPGQRLRPETFQLAPEPDIGVIGLLGLQPDQVLDGLRDRHLHPAQQSLPLQESAIECAPAEHVTSGGSATSAWCH